MKIDSEKLFGILDDEDIHELPLLTDQEKERVYAMSERKFNNRFEEDIKNESEETVVKGVERYSRPVWKRRLTAVAAALALTVGAGGGAYFLKNGGMFGSETDLSAAVGDPETEQDYITIADELLRGYGEFLRYYELHETAQKRLVIPTADGDTINLGRFANTEISSISELREFGEQYMTAQFISDNFVLPDKDITQIAEEQVVDAQTFYSVDANCIFFNFADELYTYADENYQTDVRCEFASEVYDTEPTEFKAKAKIVRSFADGEETSELPVVCVFTQDTETKEWRIASVEPDSERLTPDIAIAENVIDVQKMAEEYSDRFLEAMDLIYFRGYSEDEYITFSIDKGQQTFERQYYKMNEDESSPLNPHSIGELIEDCHMAGYLFDEMFGAYFGKDVSEYAEGDVIYDDGSDPKFVAYNGALYVSPDIMAMIDMLRYSGYASAPEIVIQTDTNIVFRRTALLDGSEFAPTFEFTLSGSSGEPETWLITKILDVDPDVPAVIDDVYAEKIVDDYNELIDALSNSDYVDMDECVEYTFIMGRNKYEQPNVYAPFEHPKFTSPEQVEYTKNLLFTDSFIEKWFLRTYAGEFGDYPSGYVWYFFTDYSTDDYDVEETPFAAEFIHRYGVLYRYVHGASECPPYFAADREHTITVTDLSDTEKQIQVHYEADPLETYITAESNLEITLVYDGAWKIDYVQAIAVD